MNRLTSRLLPASIAAATLLLAACHHDNSSGGTSMNPPGGPPGGGTPPPPAQTSFTAFVHGLFADNTTETAAPTAVDTTDFAFTDDDNTTAYDDIIKPSP